MYKHFVVCYLAQQKFIHRMKCSEFFDMPELFDGREYLANICHLHAGSSKNKQKQIVSRCRNIIYYIVVLCARGVFLGCPFGLQWLARHSLIMLMANALIRYLSQPFFNFFRLVYFVVAIKLHRNLAVCFAISFFFIVRNMQN